MTDFGPTEVEGPTPEISIIQLAATIGGLQAKVQQLGADIKEMATECRKEMALADDLADKVEELRQMIIDICTDAGLEIPDLRRFDILSVLARYREARGR